MKTMTKNEVEAPPKNGGKINRFPNKRKQSIDLNSAEQLAKITLKKKAPVLKLAINSAEERQKVLEWQKPLEQKLDSMRRNSAEVMKWTPDEMSAFVLNIPFWQWNEYYSDLFKKQSITGEKFLTTNCIEWITHPMHWMRFHSEQVKILTMSDSSPTLQEIKIRHPQVFKLPTDITKMVPKQPPLASQT
ncbi:hypothetical protein RFI_30646 [Reticulomyxa filosa]|uniref:Uncharacterized protein n=1 Tax=Reticulomyxa filosa TaxID=46433 RepID=X6LZG3_RETFI|nr:hypothetical protein RFI_30646 [Reticulomyxa filosa]|eukprot:ETO06746.1 hypothetical protein RFI_30646 [Reticulomyxa filosa]